MKYIKQISKGYAVYREEPHTDKTITNASIDTGAPLADLEVVDNPTMTGPEWTAEIAKSKPWVYKMKKSDITMMPRVQEDILDMVGTTDLAEQTLNKYNAKKALRATKPED
tara:strand:- start:28 stop:360 length:333 start_codon:yes stop_codon:yes gene_type:complete